MRYLSGFERAAVNRLRISRLRAQQGFKAVAMHNGNGNVRIAHEKRENRQRAVREGADRPIDVIPG